MSEVAKSPSAQRIERWAARINRLPRLARVILSLVITLEVTALMWLLLALVFDLKLDEVDSTTTIVLVIVLGLGLAAYVVGWWAMVGFDLDPDRPWQAGTATVLYVAGGIIAQVLLLVLALFGLAFGYIL
ncbi:MAG: hypothetical protein GYB65_05960 [Chloroflexi bacterium]|nr:hypothetical protein [Chloroflexota bacterium]